MTNLEVAKESGYSQSAIQNWSTKLGVSRQEKWIRVKELHGEEIVRMYTEDNATLLEIAEGIDDCHYSTIRKILEESGVVIRSMSENKLLRDERYIHRKYSLNEDYFKTWSSEMAYILGFIAADGCIHTSTTYVNNRPKNKHVMKIILQEADKPHLERIGKALGYGGSVKVYPVAGNTKREGLNYSSLDINSVTLVNDIKDIGIRERKSLDKEVPVSLPEEYEIDYIRGYFDGNGSVGIQYPTNSQKTRTKTVQIRVRISSGSKVNLEQIQDLLTKHGLKRKKVSSAKSGNIHELCYSTKESLVLYHLFYSEEGSMRLDRKHEDFKDYVELRKKHAKENSGIKVR